MYLNRYIEYEEYIGDLENSVFHLEIMKISFCTESTVIYRRKKGKCTYFISYRHTLQKYYVLKHCTYSSAYSMRKKDKEKNKRLQSSLENESLLKIIIKT